MKNFKKKSSGFSLMELMIVVAIIGILTAIAYPAYTSHIVKTRRAEGQAALAHLASLMERYFSNNNTYATATIAAGNPATDVLTSNMTAENWYQLSITAQTASAYTLQATPQGDQATEDTLCANLTLNSLAVKGFSGTGTLAQCW